MSVYGLVYGSTASGTYPDPYDVRFGVDNGNGQLGTLTLPATGNVRLGIQYGGDGTQYTGTLYVASGGGDWTETMLDLWHEQWRIYGTTATYGADTFHCIKDPVKKGFTMTQNAMDGKSMTILDMLRTDAIANGLYAIAQSNPATKRPIVTVSGKDYTINQLENDDDEQPSIRISAFLLQ